MSHNDSIISMLNLKEKNIFFEENFCQEETIRGVRAKIFYATLTYTPVACPHCGNVFDSNIIKHGFKKSRITLPKVSEFDTYLNLNKQRYYCKHCNHTFTLSTPIVKENCCISNNTKLAIALKAKDKISEKDIAKHYHVSHCTVNRIIDDFYAYHNPKRNYLPRHLCFDEFKSVKAASGAMSFIFCEATTGQVVDIVEDRRLDHLIKYFMTYSKAARHAVRTIVIDMYSPYMSLIKTIFPKAKIILDRFHIVQLLNRSLNKTRVRVMNNNKEFYNILKRYWKLLLKKDSEIDCSNSRYNRIFKKCMRETDILNYMLELDPELTTTYDFYQKAISCIKYRKINHLKLLLNNIDPLISDYMKTSIQSLINYQDYVCNALIYEYSNGRLEGINNKIKVIKRIAFGYRSFYHFRNRILVNLNIVKIKAA